MGSDFPQDEKNGYCGPMGRFYAHTKWTIEEDRFLILSYYRADGTKIAEKRLCVPPYDEHQYLGKKVESVEFRAVRAKRREGSFITFEDGTTLYLYMEKIRSEMDSGRYYEKWGKEVNGIEVAENSHVIFALKKMLEEKEGQLPPAEAGGLSLAPRQASRPRP